LFTEEVVEANIEAGPMTLGGICPVLVDFNA
jgi:hypothetical protein